MADARQKKGEKKTGVKNATDLEVSPAVSFTMMAPAAFELGAYTKIRLFMFEEAFRYIVDGEREKFGDTEEDSAPALSEIPVGALITAELHNSDGVVFNRDKIELVWNGQYIIFPFAAKIPADYSDSNICIDATISINHFPYIKMQILPGINVSGEQKLSLVHRFVEKAFISYSHKDINEVVLIYDTMKKCCPKTHYFFDKMDIPTGHRWSSVIQEQIDCSEVFYLCWSRNAKESEEVTKEWTYAIERHGIDVIDPIPLELVESCGVPKELAGIQFNTNTMFIKEFYRGRLE